MPMASSELKQTLRDLWTWNAPGVLMIAVLLLAYTDGLQFEKERLLLAALCVVPATAHVLWTYRTILALYLIMSRGLVWVLEQPSTERIRGAVAFCSHQKRVKQYVRRDKYEPTVKLYWVDTKISGKYEKEANELYRESVTGEGDAEDFQVGGVMNKDDPMDFDEAGSGDDADDDHEEDDDGASKSHRGKIDKAAEEAAMEDVENVRSVMANLLKAQGRLNATSDKLREIGSEAATESEEKIQNHVKTLMKLHDELADVKSHFDGHGDFDAKCSRAIMEDVKDTPKAAAKAAAAKPAPKAAPATGKRKGSYTCRGGLKKRIRTDGPVATALVQSVVKGVFWYHNEQCQVSEKHACSLMGAIWEEIKDLPGADTLPSTDVIRKAATLSQTGHECRLCDALEEMKLSAAIPISYVDVGTAVQHPIFGIRDFLSSLSERGKSDLLFCGHPETDYEDFWALWRLIQPQHPVFSQHARKDRLKWCIPVYAYADEGTSQKRRGLMVIQYQPVLGHGSSRGQDLNMIKNSLTTRFLYAVMTSHTYSGKLLKNKPLLQLVEHFAAEMGSLFDEPIPMKCVGGKTRQIRLVCLGLKGDLAALVKIGQLQRNFQRDTPTKTSGPGICHLCHAGQEGHPWHCVTFDNMSKMRENLQPPWTREPSLIRLIPQSEQHKPQFFELDLFHCAHKGVWGDIAANTIASQLSVFCKVSFFCS
ncbi:unnamed protein product [Symbiodinium microadriaticum]|nr:unnamed protein product [Symbiodinium microadriaticum]